MKIGIIGAGNIGARLARRLADSGHDIKLASSKGPEAIRELADEVGAEPVAKEPIRSQHLGLLALGLVDLRSHFNRGVPERVGGLPQKLAVAIEPYFQGNFPIVARRGDKPTLVDIVLHQRLRQPRDPPTV